MADNDNNIFTSILSHKFTYPIAIAIAYSTALYSLIIPILDAYKKADYIIGTIYLIFFVFFLILGILLRPPSAPPKPPKKGEFHGVGSLNAKEAWPRIDEKNAILNKIKISQGRPIILVGASGVGKSVLLTTQVIPNLKEENWTCVYFTNYNSFKTQLLKASIKLFPDLPEKKYLKDGDIGNIDKSKKILFIFDQFEQFLAANSEKDIESRKLREWVRSFLKNSINNDNIKHLIVVRKEWYYDLKFLAEFVPSPIESCHLNGLRMAENESGKMYITSKFKTVTKNPKITSEVLSDLMREDELLPVEVQIVGLMLENYINKSGEILSKEYQEILGGKEGLIQDFFRAYLDSSPNRDITLKVLFALSVETVLRRQYWVSQIADVVHESHVEVKKCLLFLVNEGLVNETNEGQFELAHDYLAEKFHDLSGAELDPVERDNIIFFWDEMRRRKPTDELDITRPEKSKKGKLIFSDYFMIFLSLILVFRLFGPLYGVKWEWFNMLDKYQQYNYGVDIFYLPVFISHMAWSIYVTLFYRHFFIHLKESRLRKLFSKFTVIVCTICVLTAVFIPYFWLLSIGIGGFSIGLKLFHLSKTKGLGNISISYFKGVGIKTILNVSIVIFMGSSIIFYINQTKLSIDLVEQINVVFILIAIVMTYYMISVTPLHITKKATSKMMGLIDRGRVRLQRSNFENTN